eukprot:SAG31_NODE_125_length_23649_cov_7.156202_20_plen_135_part_00
MNLGARAILGHNFGSVVLVNAVGGIEVHVATKDLSYHRNACTGSITNAMSIRYARQVMGVQFAKILYARAGLHGSAVIRHVRGGHELTVSSMGLPGVILSGCSLLNLALRTRRLGDQLVGFLQGYSASFATQVL